MVDRNSDLLVGSGVGPEVDAEVEAPNIEPATGLVIGPAVDRPYRHQ